MFVRTKKVNGNVYAYFVKNRWLNGRTAQTTMKYIGRVYPFSVTSDVEFMQFSGLEGKSVTNKELLKSLVEWELFKHGFKKGKNFWVNGEISVNSDSFSFSKNGKEVALAFNEGFLSKATVNRILNFAVSDKDEDGYSFAKAFVEAGINVPQPVFVHIFSNARRK
jgi:hypothetical protein